MTEPEVTRLLGLSKEHALLADRELKRQDHVPSAATATAHALASLALLAQAVAEDDS